MLALALVPGMSNNRVSSVFNDPLAAEQYVTVSLSDSKSYCIRMMAFRTQTNCNKCGIIWNSEGKHNKKENESIVKTSDSVVFL